MVIELRIIFWFLVAALTGFIFYKISFIIAPFIIAIVLSYFLHPAIQKLESYNISRSLAVFLVMLLFLTAFVIFGLLLVPFIYDQMILLIKAIPSYYASFKNEIYPSIVQFTVKHSLPINLENEFSFDYKKASLVAKNLSIRIFDSTSGVINFLSVIFIVPILIFYFLKDWGSFQNNFFGHVPTSIKKRVDKVFKDIDDSLSGYMRGQAYVCFIMAIIYSVLLFLTGLDFGILIGVLTGIFTFVPYIGALTGFIVALVIALFQWGFSSVDILLVLIAFGVGQFVESNFLTPRLIGDRVGLHPIWIIFGIFAFGALFGFFGVLFAMPLTAVFGVLIKDLVFEYKKKYVKK